MKSLTINSLIIFCSVIFAAPQAIAETPSDTRVEKYENLTETDAETPAAELDSEEDATAESETEKTPAAESDVEAPAADLNTEEPDTRIEKTLEETN